MNIRMTIRAAVAASAIILWTTASSHAQVFPSSQVTGASRIFTPDNLLKEKFVSEVTACRGWGKWTTPFVLANTSTEMAKFLNGAISIPAKGFAVHPGPDRDVAVGWMSPITGKVNLRAKVTDAHPSGWDGVGWAIIHENQKKQKVLVEGVIDRGGSELLAGAANVKKLTAIVVQKGDLLALVIGRRENHHCDTTFIELAIADAEQPNRVWDLAKDVVTDIHAGNPHADSFGHAATWQFFAPPTILRQLSVPEESLVALRPKVGQRIASWTVATEDTKLTIGVTREGHLCISELSNPAAGWNWTAEPSLFPLFDKAAIGNTLHDLCWKDRKSVV